MKIRQTVKFVGFTLPEVMIIVAVLGMIIGLIAIIAVPNYWKARRGSQQNACISNMRQIDGGKEQWAMAAGKVDGDMVKTASVNEYIKGNTTPLCPGGGTYTYNNIGANPECNIKRPTSHRLPSG